MSFLCSKQNFFLVMSVLFKMKMTIIFVWNGNFSYKVTFFHLCIWTWLKIAFINLFILQGSANMYLQCHIMHVYKRSHYSVYYLTVIPALEAKYYMLVNLKENYKINLYFCLSFYAFYWIIKQTLTICIIWI